MIPPFLNQKSFLKPVLILVFFVLVCPLVPLKSSAENFNDEDIFFSYERFYLNAGVLKDPPRDGRVQSDISSFFKNFSDGIYDISDGDLEKAKTRLLKARAIWPEYFGTDFLLARLYEDTEDYKLSARFYKSYLNKLKAYSQGEYRVSAQLTRSLTPYSVESYEDAYLLVKERLQNYGIDINKVKPVYTVPPFVIFLIIFILSGTVYVTVAYKVRPYIKLQRRINNPPEGFWVCKKCGTDNTILQKECEKCGAPPDSK
jgi:tetratricopeptide (TPR) repeat protein